ncbi:hypothetical protein BSIN_5263 [Burkholderia singularis]|uniref:Uncharacterized protein n=1 Tax=Burkholderia singularis TaxID=1503053 RepID=A0A238HCU7_9BURK|nr:hypothetical protein BSIN_5263 [Burkholderia singularis]
MFAFSPVNELANPSFTVSSCAFVTLDAHAKSVPLIKATELDNFIAFFQS